MLLKNKDLLKETLRSIPSDPGVYKYYNLDHELLYIGKAKHLRKRITSYFLDLKNKDRKTQRLVTQIEHIEFTVVGSEYEALLLENNLIKSHKPKYNILLRDDKSFPFICITDEPFPKLIVTRKPDLHKGKFFGPYTSVPTMHDLADSLRKIFQLRTCDLNLSAHHILANKYKVCLEYHIDNCKGPCVNLENSEDYQNKIKQVIHVLKGNYALAKEYLNQQMTASSQRMKFEEANAYKMSLSKIGLLEQKSVIVNPDLGCLIILGIHSNEQKSVVSFLRVQNGAIVQTFNLEIKKKLNERDEEILFHAYLKGINALPPNEPVDAIISNITPLWSNDIIYDWQIPKIGDKKKLLDIALKNAFITLNKRTEPVVKKNYLIEVVKTLQAELNLKDPPLHIECFDNSNIQGTNPVASMVCFKNGKASKRDYRHFNIKTVEGPDDFASMKEIVSRRYKRVLEEALPLPGLVVIDGGKGQLGAAVEALKEVGVYGRVPVIGLAKRIEEIFFPGDQESIILGRRSEGLRLLQQIRDEAHRFAITFHRNQRSKDALQKSILIGIEGIGNSTIKKLMDHFKSVKSIQEASIESLSAVIGTQKAMLIENALKKP